MLRPEKHLAQIALLGSSDPAYTLGRDRAPLAAAADPISSHLAAEAVTNSGRRASQKRDILAWLRAQSQPFTSAGLARAAGLDRYMVARRLPDLAHDGLVERCAMRECTASGRQAITWRAL